jgi:hypothetical protein
MMGLELEAVEALDRGIKALGASIRWQTAAAAVVMGGPTAMHRRLIELAVESDEIARVELNKVRELLGGVTEPDPAEPPPPRPDD